VTDSLIDLLLKKTWKPKKQWIVSSRVEKGLPTIMACLKRDLRTIVLELVNRQENYRLILRGSKQLKNQRLVNYLNIFCIDLGILELY